MGKHKTTEEFIIDAKKVHGDRYDYSLSEYIGNKIKVEIICSIHGVFKQTPDNHSHNHGCPKCVGLYMDNDLFIEKSIIIHKNKYNYSLINYINNSTPIKIICPEHGVFEQSPHAHLNGSGCPKCVGFNKTTEEFIKEAKLIHDNKYDYSLVEYKNATNKIKIICNKHGIFEQTPNKHLNGNGCKHCFESKGEMRIVKFLDDNNVEYVREKRFKNCNNLLPLFFDFYLPQQNKLIEYDGEQHFKSVKYWGGDNEYIKRQNNDNIKNNFANANNIELIRIKYNEINNINQILNKAI